MAKIKKIKVLSFMKFQAFLGLLFGLLAGVLYSFGGLIIDTLVSLEWISSSETSGLSFGTVLAFGALLGMPVIFMALSAILGFFEAVLYNLYVRSFGGIELDIDDQ